MTVRGIGFQLFAILLGIAATQTGAQAQEMDYDELRARPDLWPIECRLLDDTKFGDQWIDEGTALSIVTLQESRVGVMLGDGSTGGVQWNYTDILEVANRERAALSPEQLELTLQTLAERPQLWPDQIQLIRPLALTRNDGSRLTVPVGEKYGFGCIDGKELRLSFGKSQQEVPVPAHSTNLLRQARARLADMPAKPQSRILRDLEGKLIDLDRKGRKAKFNKSKPPSYILLYFSAGWCGPCRRFSPQLVNFYENNKAAGKTFEVVFISRDHTEAEMKTYASEAGFPWLAVPFDKLADIPVVQAYGHRGVPHLLVLDQDGRVLADSYRGTEFLGAGNALHRFQEILDAQQGSKRKNQKSRP